MNAPVYRAVVAGVPSTMTARLLWRWLEAGHQVTELWMPAGLDRGMLRQERQLGIFRPGWSVAAAVRRFNIPVRDVGREVLAKDGSLAESVERSDLILSCLFPYRVPSHLLTLAGGRALNLHPAMLPAWRGSTPMLSMVRAGRAARDGGVTLHVMVDRFDAGAIVAAVPVPLHPGKDWIWWAQALSRASGDLVHVGVEPFLRGEIEPRLQPASPTPYAGRANAQFAIDRTTSYDQADRHLSLFGRSSALDLKTDDRTIRVLGRARSLGPPTGEPPRVGPFFVTMDLADARCRFRRRLPGASRRFRLKRLLRWIMAPY
ncbi:MAG: formyltransferase family protein [Pseudomonadota bacterium]